MKSRRVWRLKFHMKYTSLYHSSALVRDAPPLEQCHKPLYRFAYDPLTLRKNFCRNRRQLQAEYRPDFSVRHNVKIDEYADVVAFNKRR